MLLIERNERLIYRNKNVELPREIMTKGITGDGGGVREQIFLSKY